MGNRASYDQVPVGDMGSPSLHPPNPQKNVISNLPETDKRPVDIKDWGGTDLMFVFHDTEEDSEERVVHDQINKQRPLEDELKFTVTANNRIICERRDYAEAIDVNSLCSILDPGDLVEFCSERRCHHWVVYLGNKTCIRLKRGKVTEEKIQTVYPDRMARIVNSCYRFKSLPPQQICSAAKSQVGKDPVWASSEAFAAWCRFGCAELMMDKVHIKDLDSDKPDSLNQLYKLEIFNKSNSSSEIQHFSSISDLIKYRRKREKET